MTNGTGNGTGGITTLDMDIDAHLYALGITSDARRTSVLIIGHDQAPISSALCARLLEFGAQVHWDNDAHFNPDLRVDYVAAVANENHAYRSARTITRMITEHLRAGGRYLVLVDSVGDSHADVEITDVRQVGDGQVRVLGWKRRRLAEVSAGGVEVEPIAVGSEEDSEWPPTHV